MRISDVLPILFEGVDPNEVSYHKDVGFPDELEFPRGLKAEVDLHYGSHAREQAIVEKYGLLRLPYRIDLRKVEIFEVATRRGSNVISKVCVRMSHDQEKDIIIVFFVPDGFVKTVWANLKTDHHRTLNRSRYVDPNAKPRQRMH